MSQVLPLISVIIPIYKVEKYLPDCLDSVLTQEYSNMEIILVDDGSPDGCPAICDHYAKNDQRIRVIHQKNAGLAAARNAGLDMARGSLVGFVDSDDMIDSAMYSNLYEALMTSGADLSVCNYRQVDEVGRPLPQEDGPIRDEVLEGTEAIIRTLEQEKNWYWVIACNKLYKSHLFNTVRFPQGKVHEDEFVIHKILVQCNKLACVSDDLYLYRQRDSGITGSSYSIKRLDGAEALFDRAQVLLADGRSPRSAYYACSAGLMAMAKSYERLDTKDALFRKRYKELCELYRPVASGLLKAKLPLVLKARLMCNRISPFYTWKYLERLMRGLGAGASHD